jgi:hypothetical protein
MEESTFVYEELQGFKGDEDEHIAPVPTSSPELVPAFTLEVVASQAATSIGVQVSWIEGGSTLRMEPHPTFRRHIQFSKS